MKLTGRTIVDARARPEPATIVFDRTIGRVGKRPESPVTGPEHDAFIVPGLIDSHTHPVEVGLQLLFTNMGGADTVAGVQQRLRDRRGDARALGMMLGFNLEPDRLAEHRYPDRGELDAVIPDVPVFVYRVDGHSAVTNTVGLELVLAAWPGVKPPGMESDCRGRPTGVLRGEAYERASRLFKARLAPDTVLEALRLAGGQAAAGGVATIGALVGADDLADAEWRVILEGLTRSAVTAVPYLQTWNVEVPKRFGLKQAGGCLLIDGSFGSRTAALNQPYSDAPGDTGAGYVSDDRLVSFLKAAAAAGLQTAVHAIGDRAVEQVIRCHEQLGGGPAGPNRLRHRVEHAELLGDSLVRRIASLGLVLGVQPVFEAKWGGPDRMYASRLGERWRDTNPYRRLLDSGVRLAGGSDAPITPIDPLAGMRAAIERANPEESVNGDEALAMFTSTAAFALNLEGTHGSIATGRDADLTVLTSDPRTGSPCRVVATFRAGRCIYRNDELDRYLKLED